MVSKPKKKRRRDRNRPWHEIARLQAESENLEREIENRLAKSSAKNRATFHKLVQNVEMKTLLRETLEETQALEQTLQRQTDELMQVMRPRSLVLTTRVLSFDPFHDIFVFSTMADRVDDQYKDMDRVLRRVGLEGATSEIVDAYVCRASSFFPKGGDGNILKFRSRALKPFNKSTLEKAFWRYVDASGRNQAPGNFNFPLGLASRLVVQKYECAVDNYTCTMRVLIKQFVEKDRTMQVWNMLVDWQNFGEEMQNVQTYEHGWGFIQSMKNSSASVCGGCIIMRPVISGNGETIGALNALYQGMLMSRIQELENESMDQFLLEKNTSFT
ncbi:hypothetical protein PHPALM_28002 [Phytophthora palmivora]|uniref:M96 mating-specific protein family n=1 Tax=Phytophthora palmivora TaxID=4796 RepID=A0A2P4XB78_9STRA|nr:hypothetical protein PHPALM_28002 [Phytophthora palmivora]